MTTVYVVTSGSYSDYRIKGIFSTRAKAETYISQCRASEACWDKDFNDIVEWLLNHELEECEYTRYSCGVALDDGSLLERKYSQQIWGLPESKSYIAENVPAYGGRGIARAESHKSQEHAFKLAVEARQKWLRERKMKP